MVTVARPNRDEVNKKVSVCNSPILSSSLFCKNLQFDLKDKGKWKNGKGDAFTAWISESGDDHISYALGTAYNADSSITGISPSNKTAGFPIKKELDCFVKTSDN